MHDKLAERCRPLVAAPPMHHQQPANVLELRDGEVRGQGSLPALLKRTQVPAQNVVPLEGTSRTQPPRAKDGHHPSDPAGDRLTQNIWWPQRVAGQDVRRLSVLQQLGRGVSLS